MFSNEYGEAAVEVLDILDNTNEEDVKKIPQSFIKFLVDNTSLDYIVNFDHSKPLNELNITEKTRELLGYIYINWWCDEKEKQGYMEKIKESEIALQEKNRELYDPDKIFENRRKLEQVDTKEKVETTQMVEYKENIFRRFINKIMNFFKK